jgi:xanthine/uracil permease
MVATAGVRILQQVELSHRNLLIVATSISLGIGVESVPEVLLPLPETLKLLFSSAVTTGGIAALLLNTLMPNTDATPITQATAMEVEVSPGAIPMK